jgi:hypothetical protein
MIADIATGHTDLADVLFLLAAILFVIEGLAIAVSNAAIGRGILVAFGLAAVAVGWLVL